VIASVPYGHDVGHIAQGSYLLMEFVMTVHHPQHLTAFEDFLGLLHKLFLIRKLFDKRMCGGLV
jgi:hypothetical protein